MRTTVTLDSDTELLLKEHSARSGQSFKAVLNDAVRRALGATPISATADPLFPAPFPPYTGSWNRFAEDEDDEATLRELGA